MKNTAINTGASLMVIGVILSLAALPLLMGVTGCVSGSRYEQSSGERIDDQATTARVRTALANDSEYKYGTVSVETFKGTVHLSGFVNSRAQKNRAGDITREVAGVKAVDNNMTVRESAN